MGEELLEVFGLGRVVVAATIFFLVVEGLAPHTITWWEAAFVFAVSYVGGTVSLIPGRRWRDRGDDRGRPALAQPGARRSQGGGPAARVSLSGMAALMGLSAYAIAQRRYHISGFGALRARAGREQRGAGDRPR